MSWSLQSYPYSANPLIMVIPAYGERLVWENDAQRSWDLTPDLSKLVLHTDTSNPYFNPRRPETTEFRLNVVNGFDFNSEWFERIGD